MVDRPRVVIDENGIHKPTFEECYTYVRDAFREANGLDIVWEPEDRDTQFLSIIAAAMDDGHSDTVAAYNSFRPQYAQGVALSTLGKIQGITRKIPTYSTVLVRVSGRTGTIIDGGIVTDALGRKWNLPAIVVIPDVGQIDVTATASEKGAWLALVGTVNKIFTPQVGWQGAVSISDATPGAPIERDGEFRQRYGYSASLPAVSSFDALRAAIGNINTVPRSRIYRNDSPGVDARGIPGHSIAVVVDGGYVPEIVAAIALKKGEGVATFGTQSAVTAPTAEGVSQRIYFSITRSIPITFSMSIIPLNGFTEDIKTAIMQSLTDWVNAHEIGDLVALADAYLAARLYGAEDSRTYKIVPGTLKMARDHQLFSEADIQLRFDEGAFSQLFYNSVTVLLT